MVNNNYDCFKRYDSCNTIYNFINRYVLGIQYVNNGKWFMELYMDDFITTNTKLC